MTKERKSACWRWWKLVHLVHRLRHWTLCRVAHGVGCRGCQKCWDMGGSEQLWPEVRADGSWWE